MTRLLCLGDSYTIGEGVDDAGTWPHRVAAAVGASVEVIAQTGWTVSDLLGGMDRAEPIAIADLVTVLIGVNDQYDETPFTGITDVLGTLLDRAAALTGDDPGRVLLISIPDWSATPFAADRDRAAIGRQIGRYNDGLRDLAARRGHPFIDIEPLTKGHGDLVVDDGLHPSAGAYRDWSDAVITPAIKSTLRSAEN